MKSPIRIITSIGAALALATFTFIPSASAHVVVKPAEVVTAGFQTFTIGVPNEKAIATTSLKLLIPAGLKYVSPTQKAGWQIDIEKEGSGEDAIVKSITWSGSTVEAGFRDDFTFSGQAPANPSELQWKAYQTYADGSVVAWDKASSGDDHASEDANSGPFSITKVVSQTASDVSVKQTDQAAGNAKSAADTALSVGIAGLVIALISLYFASRKK